MREFDPPMMAKEKSLFKFKPVALGVALLCAFNLASALTIDRVGGNIILGRPLDLSVKVSVAADEELEGLCPAADVSYGDAVLDSSRVSVSSAPGSAPGAFYVRIRSSNPVDEPLVTLDIKAGCKQVVSRRFVLLSELAADIQRPLPAVSVKEVQPLIQKPKVTPELVLKPEPVTVPSVIRVKPKVQPPKEDVATPSPVVKKSTEQKSLLKLAPIDLSQDWDPVLQVTSEILALPEEDASKRKEAAALWRYLNLSPKDYLRFNAQEDELNQLKLMMEKSQQQLQELNQQLLTAESQRFSNPLVYSLLALILMLLGGAAYLYHRMGGRGIPNAQWWKTLNASSDFKPSQYPLEDDALVLDAKADSPAQAKPKIPVESAPSKPDDSSAQESKLPDVVDELDFEIDVEPVASAVSVPVAAADAIQHKDFEHSMSGALRSINTHDMLDIRQQAEFFMTLGQYEDAIDMLQNSIHQNDAANPLVYLDLLKILHTLSRKTEFDSIRKDFNRIFSGRVAAYIAFNEPSKGLDTYHELCERIVAAWPHQASVEYIEQCLVRGTVHVASGRIDLEAFRDLLMLHEVAKQFDESGVPHNHVFSTAKMDLDNVNDFADSEPISLDITPAATEDRFSVATDLLLPPVFEGPAEAEVDLDLSEPKNNLIDFDPSIFSLDLPETKNP